MRMIRLKVETGPKKGRDYLCRQGDVVIIGRSRNNKIPVADVMASRQHARLWFEGESWWIEDLGSRNGVLVNKEKHKKTSFKIGDKLQIGNTVFSVDEPAPGRLVGKEIAGYQCLEKVGEGGMGEVYRAHQKSLDRIVALKILSEKLQKKKDVVKRFIEEARRAGSLNHPNIIHVHDVGQTEDGVVYFSMEYIDGVTLKEWFAEYRQQRTMPPLHQLCKIFSKAAAALHCAHMSKIVHRDVKPDNIMLTKEGEVKLADLGISLTVGEAMQEKPKGGKRQVVGTPHYIAPEQILDRPVDGRLDIYSLGATAYHIFTGRTLFRGKKPEDVIKSHLKLIPLAAGDINEDLPEFIEDIIMKMVEKKPSLRFQQAAEVSEVFKQAADKLESGSRFGNFFERFKKPQTE